MRNIDPDSAENQKATAENDRYVGGLKLSATIQAEEAESASAINPTPHLCRAKVKQTALEIAHQVRPFWRVERVGMSFLERIEAATRQAIIREVKQHPTRGKTLL